jgi:predicted tellurium resistance membrane protein TerC
MINNKVFQDLLQKEMDRKQFLKVLGAGIMAMIGVTAFLNNLEKISRVEVAPKQANPKIKRKGYGISPYGL